MCLLLMLQAVAARWRIQHSAWPSTSLPKLLLSPLLQSNAVWSARTSFFKVHLHMLALRKGRAGITNVLLICITFFVSHKQRVSVACLELTRKADKKSSCSSTNWVSDWARSKTEIFHLLLLSLYHASNYPLFILFIGVWAIELLMFSNIDVRVKLRFYLHCIVKYKHPPDGLVFFLVQGSRGEKQLSIVSHMYSVSERGAITLVQGTVSQ